MSHQSEVLSPGQWDTITPLLPELMSLAPIVSCLKAFFGSDAQVPVVQIYRTDPLACQRADLDDVGGKRREVVTGVAQVDRQGRTFIDGSYTAAKKGSVVEKLKAARVRNGGKTAKPFLSEATFVRPSQRK